MSQSLLKVYLHIVFSTQERRDLIPENRKEEVWSYIGGVINHSGGQSMLVGGTSNHVHILCAINATTTIAEFVRDVKSRSSKWIKDNVCVRESFAWKGGYGVFSVSESVVPAVREYISKQEEHHKKVSFEDEYVAFLQKHNVQYDEKYLWT